MSAPNCNGAWANPSKPNNVPTIGDPDVAALLKKLGTTEDPVFVPVAPNEMCGPPGYCVHNVRERGLEAVSGWTIWIYPTYIEAELHQVCSVKGALIDVTEKSDGELRTMFVPDSRIDVDVWLRDFPIKNCRSHRIGISKQAQTENQEKFDFVDSFQRGKPWDHAIKKVQS